ncbi:MAG: hypothetical protein HY064_11960 [Bacteroidetes bacterium]|nr:hypothetical protein [Bacteroidota bacterium]
MKNIFFLFAFPFFLMACSGDEKKTNTPDSAKDSIGKITLQTDSGKMVVATKNGVKDGNAVLYFPDGKVKQKGMFLEGKVAGAWVTYDENGNAIKAEHISNGKVLHELDVNDFNFRDYRNEKMGISFNVPKAWKEIESPNGALLVSFEKELNDTSVKMKPNFNVAMAVLQPGDDLASLAQMQIQVLHENMGRVEIVNEEKMRIDSCDAFRRYGMYYDEQEKVGFLNLIIISGKNVWFFSCDAQNNSDAEFLKYQGVFEAIVESFHRLN